MQITASQKRLRRNPRNIPRNKETLSGPVIVHALKRYRPIGCFELSLLETPDPPPCDYPVAVEMPGIGPHRYAIQLRAGQRGRQGAPDYSPTSDLYPILERLAQRLAVLWIREGAPPDVPRDLLEKARRSPDDAAPAIIKHFRDLDVSSETLNKKLQVYRMLHPTTELRDGNLVGRKMTLPETRARLDATIEAFLTICPPEGMEPPRLPPCPVEGCGKRTNHAGPHT